ncbi:hypothetical protein ACWEKT_30015 [Nocardia takedensis]
MLYENSATGRGTHPALATTTIACAAVGAVLNLVGGLRLGSDFYGDPGRFDNSLATIAVLGSLLLAVALTYGAYLLYRGEDSGRYTIMVAAGTWATLAVIGLLSALIGYHSEYGVQWFADASRVSEALFATCGIAGAVTALLEGDWTANLAGLAVPLVITLSTVRPGAR